MFSMILRSRTSTKIVNVNSPENRSNASSSKSNLSHKTIINRSKSVFAGRLSTMPIGSNVAINLNAAVQVGTILNAQQSKWSHNKSRRSNSSVVYVNVKMRNKVQRIRDLRVHDMNNLEDSIGFVRIFY